LHNWVLTSVVYLLLRLAAFAESIHSCRVHVARTQKFCWGRRSIEVRESLRETGLGGGTSVPALEGSQREMGKGEALPQG
jgi:hypothetical protein